MQHTVSHGSCEAADKDVREGPNHCHLHLSGCTGIDTVGSSQGEPISDAVHAT